MSAEPVIAPGSPEARLVRVAALEALEVAAGADCPRARASIEAGARMQALSEVATFVLRIAAVHLPFEFPVLVSSAVREVGPYPEGRGSLSDRKADREAWHAQVLDSVNARLAEVAR